ncbi:hypothetical protein, partial [Xanthomonas phaseoli]
EISAVPAYPPFIAVDSRIAPISVPQSGPSGSQIALHRGTLVMGADLYIPPYRRLRQRADRFRLGRRAASLTSMIQRSTHHQGRK